MGLWNDIATNQDHSSLGSSLTWHMGKWVLSQMGIENGVTHLVTHFIWNRNNDRVIANYILNLFTTIAYIWKMPSNRAAVNKKTTTMKTKQNMYTEAEESKTVKIKSHVDHVLRCLRHRPQWVLAIGPDDQSASLQRDPVAFASLSVREEMRGCFTMTMHLLTTP